MNMKLLNNNMKNILNDENKTKVIGLLTILLLLWLLLYFIPELFTSLFSTLLGNLILLTTSALVLMYNVKYGIILSIIFILLYRFYQLAKNNTNTQSEHKREGFTWNPQSTQDFLLIQTSINPQKIFDVNMIQKNQASQQEVEYFNKHGLWPWSPQTKELYMESINANPYIRTWPEDSLNYARSIYNEAAILRLLSYQTKEGLFLLNGVLVKDPTNPNKAEELPSGFGEFPYSSGLKENRTSDVIKCNMSKPNNVTLERIRYTGKGGIYGEQTTQVTPVDYNNLENIIPGFTFVDRPCNPCGALNETPDYSCPFRLKIKNKSSFISNVWQKLWNVNDKPLHKFSS